MRQIDSWVEELKPRIAAENESRCFGYGSRQTERQTAMLEDVELALCSGD